MLFFWTFHLSKNTEKNINKSQFPQKYKKMNTENKFILNKIYFLLKIQLCIMKENTCNTFLIC